MSALLETRSLKAGYLGREVVRAVNLKVQPGEVVCLLGPNGAGKTTLLRTVSGLHRSESGTVQLGGTDITRVASEKMPGLGMSHVPEGRGVITELSVDENLRLGGLARGRVKTDELERIYSLFPPLDERRHVAAATLSGGERQMLVIGRALMARPTVLLLDEPSLGLAPRIVTQIFDLLRGLVVDEGLTVLLVEQNARSALSVADHGVVLNLGTVVADESATVLAADDQLRHAYLGF